VGRWGCGCGGGACGAVSEPACELGWIGRCGLGERYEFMSYAVVLVQRLHLIEGFLDWSHDLCISGSSCT
jgi:hypothetical protein